MYIICFYNQVIHTQNPPPFFANSTNSPWSARTL